MELYKVKLIIYDLNNIVSGNVGIFNQKIKHSSYSLIVSFVKNRIKSLTYSFPFSLK